MPSLVITARIPAELFQFLFSGASASVFSERELTSVCLSVVCNVRAPYSGDWNFRQCFYAILAPWPSVDIQVKFYGYRPSWGTPTTGELNTGVAEYSDF